MFNAAEPFSICYHCRSIYFLNSLSDRSSIFQTMIILRYTSCSKFLIVSRKFHKTMQIQFRADALAGQLRTKQLIAQKAEVFPIHSIGKIVSISTEDQMAKNVFAVVQSCELSLTVHREYFFVWVCSTTFSISINLSKSRSYL